ncbi:CAAX prenyl protease 1 homolog [Ctenocephalides felis]|uniref:CAAX prenyl protease 1 homolog n=1 Tax=Ctenocephalides felis TaxID=7515 RepID=UPI000E6E489C|nr:CAAX prenyl protease 1 homolog [Ctenocephalides felis]
MAYVALDTAWEIYLTYRQIRVYKTTPKPPDAIKNVFKSDTFEKSRLYSIDRAKFSIFEMLFGTCLEIASLLRHGLYSSWKTATKIAVSIGFKTDNLFPITISFIVIDSIVSTIINLPLAIYYIFVIEEKHGFNNQTFGFFVKDGLKIILLQLIIFVPILTTIMYILHYGGEHAHIWLWGFTFVIMILMAFIFPKFIDPEFNKFTPLPDGPLRTSIEQLASSVNFPLSQVLIVDGSTRSGHENAYFTGTFGAKRIILYDTLLNEVDGRLPYENDEILAILCHELGHWKHSHIYSMMVLSQLAGLLTFVIFNSMIDYSPLYQAFGFPEGLEPPIIGSIIIQQYVMAPYQRVIDFFFTWYTRYNEFEADAFAVKMKLGNQLKLALLKISQNNLTFPVDDWLFTMFNNDHPTLLERIEYIDKIKSD